MNSNLYEIPVQNIKGEQTTLEAYKGKVLLIVNVASKCGFTPQYKELEELHQKYKDKGFAVLGFPCDQFLHQEPGNNQAIQEFAESCFRITFPLFAKIDVKGSHRSPLYTYLKKNIKKKPFIFIPWNFTKILVDNEGRVLQRFTPTTAFKKIIEVVEPLLPLQN